MESYPFQPLIDSWPLMGSPLPLAFVFGIYFTFVLNVGPRYMRNRKPMNLDGFIRGYNVFQIIACTYFVKWTIDRGVTYKSTWQCLETKKDSESYLELCNHIWYFLLLRLAELSETVVFVLRKKQNQVSILHLYHHTSTIALVWLFLKYSPSEMALYLSALNCVVHVVMYSYYFLSSLRGAKKFNACLNSIKPLITIIQLIQLVIFVGESIVAVLPSCKTTNLFYLKIANSFILLVFFSNFYIQSYLYKRNKKV